MNVNLKQPQQDLPAEEWEALVLQLQGVEQSVIVTEHTRQNSNNESNDDDSNSTTTEYSVDRDSHTVIHLVIPIHRFGGSKGGPPLMTNGQYEYPFEVQLPQDLPASMDFESDMISSKRRNHNQHHRRRRPRTRNNNHNVGGFFSNHTSLFETKSHCELEYQLTAELLKRRGAGTTSTSTSWFSSLSSSSRHHTVVTTSEPQLLEVEQAPRSIEDSVYYNNPSASSEVLLPERTLPVRFCCCFPMGHVKMQVHVTQTILARGSTVTITIDGRNASKFGVELIHAKLQEKVLWRANGRTEERSQVLCSGETSDELQDNDAWFARPEEHAAEYASLTTQPETTSYSGNNNYNYNDTSRTATSGHNTSNNSIQITLQVPHRARMTYFGTILEVSHSIIVTAQTPGCCFVTSPKITHEVEICNLMTPTSASAPMSTTMVMQPSAPMEEFDTQPYRPSSTQSPAPTAPHADNNHTVQMVHAEVLPDDWNPQTAPVVHVTAEQILPAISTFADNTSTMDGGEATTTATPRTPSTESGVTHTKAEAYTIS